MIKLRGARVHNLKNIDLDLPREQLVVVTGLSGSGKSSLVFDTLYAEGQRRYMESLSAYARQFLGMMERPDVDYIEGLSPVIAIDQKTVSRNPRSTVGTVTEIYDFMRLLFARCADAFSYVSGEPMVKQTEEQMVDTLEGFEEGTKYIMLAPLVRSRKGHYQDLFRQLERQGYNKVRVDGKFREIEQGMKLDRYKTHNIEVVIDRLVAKPDIRHRISGSVATALEMGNGAFIVHFAEEAHDRIFSRNLTSLTDGISYEDPSPNTFSFNTPKGACPQCGGLGAKRDISFEKLIPDASKSVAENGIPAIGKPRDTWMFNLFRALSQDLDFDFETPLKNLSDKQIDAIINGTGDKKYKVASKSSPQTWNARWVGIKPYIWHQFEQTTSNSIRKWAEAFMEVQRCESCEGAKLHQEALHYRIEGKNIAELSEMNLGELRNFFEQVQFSERKSLIAKPILKEITDRLDFLLNVGLDYLTLSRQARTLSGGESQRIRLATQIGTQLAGVLYILDEPSIGLHPRDNTRLIRSLQNLRDMGNSILVVEHDREMMEIADFVVDIGPGAGEKGGQILAAAPLSDLIAENHPESLTAQYLSNQRGIPIPTERRKGNGNQLILKGATGNNLKGQDLILPLGTFIGVTGVSGSGKSTLINHTLFPILQAHYHQSDTQPLPYSQIEGLEHLDKVIDIDQSPIGRTPRSNPATYTGLFTHIRDLFAQLPESKVRGYKSGRFSFNVKGGRCEHCQGAGLIKMEMNFLPDVYVECESCKGKRYNRETLEVRYKGLNIAEVLNLTVEDALNLFASVPKIKVKLATLAAVGMGYIRLGQQATTLSGGEAQRVKLATELSRPGTGKTLYILDEPTTGLHFEDVYHLLVVLQALVEKGNTVLVIEHNTDVIKCADWVIDLGKEGGKGGGEILFEGTPEDLAKQATYTAQFLKPELERQFTPIQMEHLQLDELKDDENSLPEEMNEEEVTE